MVRIITAVCGKDYRQKLSRFITGRIISQNQRVLFLDCLNRIDQYMFQRDHLDMILDQLYLTRLDRFFDFYCCLRSIHLKRVFWESDVLLISSYAGLMDDLAEEEQRHYSSKVVETLERISVRYRPVFLIGQQQPS